MLVPDIKYCNVVFHLNLVLLPNFIIASCKTSFIISEMLHPPTLQPNTRLYKMPNIFSRVSKKPHPATTLSKMSIPFTKNVTINTRQDRNSFLPVTTDQLNLHKWNATHLPLPLPLISMLFPDTWMSDTFWPLLLTSCLKKFQRDVLQNSWCLWPDSFRHDSGHAWSNTGNLQAYHHHIEAEEHGNRDYSATSTTAVSMPIARFSYSHECPDAWKLSIWAVIRRTSHSYRSCTKIIPPWISLKFPAAFPSELPTEEPILVPDYEPNNYSPIGEPSIFLSPYTNEIPTEVINFPSVIPKNNLPQFHVLNQETIPVLNPQVLHITSHQRSLS